MAKKTKNKSQEELLDALKDAEEEQPESTSAPEPDTEGIEKEEQEATHNDQEEERTKPATKKEKLGASPPAKPSGPNGPGRGRGREDKPAPAGSSQSRKTALVLGGIGVGLIVVAAIGYVVFGLPKPEVNNTSPPDSQANTLPSLVARRIDGVLDDQEDQNRFPVAIMVENHTASRPQSGLDKANVVYEALAEGGITRFLAVYTLTDPIAEIGPVRSARPYYVDWARGYGSMYVHIGGSPKALARISTTNTFDLNQFFNSQYFWRDKSRDVASEHTLYTSGRLMVLALIDKQAPAEGSYQPWKFKEELVSSNRPASQHVTINFSTFSYKVDYEYDPVRNDYARSVAEKSHVMRDGAQLRPKNVLVLIVKRRLEEPVKTSKGRLEMDTIGEGPARFFLDGKEVTGTWSKSSPQDNIKLVGQDGAELPINPGQTWVEIVPPEQEVVVR